MGKTKGEAKEMKKLKTIRENWDNTTQSADKKPEKYIKPDGKVGIRMVPVKKEGAMKRMATTQSNKTDRMAASDKKGLETYKKKPVDENTEIVEAQDPEMEKVKQLVRIGLMDKKDMTKIVRALTLMKDGKPVPQKERKILFDMLGELIGMITGDDAMFSKARKAVKEEKDMSAMCCKNCGDEFGKPKSEGCMYDAYNAEGKNWIKKESYSEEVEQIDELTAAELKLINQMYDKKGNLTPMGKKVMAHGKSNSKLTPKNRDANNARRKEYNAYQKSKRNEAVDVEEALERDGPKKPDIFGPKGSFGKAASANPNVQKYMAKKAADNKARNKAMDPGADKKGYGIGVTDTNKADKKAKAKGTSMMKRMASRGKMYKAGKMM